MGLVNEDTPLRDDENIRTSQVRVVVHWGRLAGELQGSALCVTIQWQSHARLALWIKHGRNTGTNTAACPWSGDNHILTRRPTSRAL